jgi:thiol-disulfide isomerase/thioredoxin
MKPLPSGAWILIVLVVLTAGALAVVSLSPVMSLQRLPAIQAVPFSPVPTSPAASSSAQSTPSSLPILSEPFTQLPAFQGLTRWWNTPGEKPLTLEDLKGKVVLVDFWTYSCINCIRTQPVLRAWWDAYKGQDFVLIGIHTPEFAFEKVPKNVDAAIKKANLTFPIALDPEYATWNQFANHYWPAKYYFDRQGRLRFTHFGEGDYDTQEQVIRALLAEGKPVDAAPTHVTSQPTFTSGQTPETYFGYFRADAFTNQGEAVRENRHQYTLKAPGRDGWSVGGAWTWREEHMAAEEATDAFRMNVQANAFHLVLGSMDGPKKIKVLIDGKNPSPNQLTDDTVASSDGTVTLTVSDKTLYRIARFPDAGRHTVELELIDGGVEFYAATFGE